MDIKSQTCTVMKRANYPLFIEQSELHVKIAGNYIILHDTQSAQIYEMFMGENNWIRQVFNFHVPNKTLYGARFQFLNSVNSIVFLRVHTPIDYTLSIMECINTNNWTLITQTLDPLPKSLKSLYASEWEEVWIKL